MPRTGSGGYNLPEAPYVFGEVIDQDSVNTNLADIASALAGSMAKNGETTPTGNQPMASFRHTGVGAAAALTDYARADQVQNSAFQWCGTAGGTANALTITPSPAITAYAAGQRFTFKTGSSANTGAVTLAVSGLSATAVNLGGSACRAGSLRPSTLYSVEYDGSLFDIVGEVIPRIVTPLDFGGVGDASTDDSSAWNTMMALVRESVDAASTNSTAYHVDALSHLGYKWKISASGINAAEIVEGRLWGIKNAIILAACDDEPALDLTGSRDGLFSAIRIVGDSVTVPSVGILAARADAGTNSIGKAYGACSDHVLNAVQTGGDFLDAGVAFVASEEVHSFGCEWWNERTGDGSGESWAAIFDGRNAKALASPNATVISARASFTVHTHVGTKIQKPFGGAGPTMFVSDLASASFVKPYVTNGSGAAIQWRAHADYAPYAVHFDGLQIETTGNDFAFEFDGVSGNPDCVINDLRVSTGNIYSEDAFIKASNFGTGSLTLNDLKITVGQWSSGTPPTDFVSGGSVVTMHNAEIALPTLSDFGPTVGVASYDGWYSGRDGTRRHYGGFDNRTGGIRDAFGHFKSDASSAIADDATEVIDLTADNINADGMFIMGSPIANVTVGIDYNATSSAVATQMWAGSLVNIVTNTDLSAASLPVNAGQITVAINENEIQILNERGFTVNCNWFFMTRGA